MLGLYASPILRHCGKKNLLSSGKNSRLYLGLPLPRFYTINSVSSLTPQGLLNSNIAMKSSSVVLRNQCFQVNLQNVRKPFSTSSKVKVNYEDEVADRYQCLHRFQQFQKTNNSGRWGYFKNTNGNSLRTMTFVGVAAMTGIFLTSQFLFDYIPPFTYFQRRPREFVYTLLAINIGIFGLWQLPRCWPFLQKYMLLQKGVMTNNISIIGSSFSHQEFWHLGMNMLALWSFGTSLASMLGTANFFSLYMNSAIAGSLFSLWYPKLFRMMSMGASLGASSALFGVFGCFSWLIPNAKILLFVFPIPGGAWVAFLASVAWNAAGCVFKWGSFDYAAHLGGSLVGILYGWLIQKKLEQRKRRRTGSIQRGSGWSK